MPKLDPSELIQLSDRWGGKIHVRRVDFEQGTRPLLRLYCSTGTSVADWNEQTLLGRPAQIHRANILGTPEHAADEAETAALLASWNTPTPVAVAR